MATVGVLYINSGYSANCSFILATVGVLLMLFYFWKPFSVPFGNSGYAVKCSFVFGILFQFLLATVFDVLLNALFFWNSVPMATVGVLLRLFSLELILSLFSVDLCPILV